MKSFLLPNRRKKTNTTPEVSNQKPKGERDESHESGPEADRESKEPSDDQFRTWPGPQPDAGAGIRSPHDDASVSAVEQVRIVNSKALGKAPKLPPDLNNLSDDRR